jgi:hypothetical protein
LRGQKVYFEGQMSEKLYEFLLRLYPEHFRRTYGDEAQRLVRDRARSEKGFLSVLRLWLDLLLDLAKSLPREYSNPPTAAIIAAHSLHGERLFPLLAQPSLSPTRLCLGGTLSAALFWACGFVVAHSGGFPALFPAPLLPQEPESVLAQAGYPYEEESPVQNSATNFAAGGSAGHPVPASAYSFCVTAQQDIPGNSVEPLFAFHFASPGATGVARIDGKIVKIFENEQRLSIRAHVPAGDHQVVLHLDRPSKSTFMSSNDNFRYCQAK